MKGLSEISHNEITRLSSYPRSVKFRPMERLIKQKKMKREQKIRLILEECDKAITELNKSE